MRRKTQEEFVDEVFERCGDEYSVIGQYKNANTKIKMKHNNCCCKQGFYEWDVTPHNFLDSNRRCPVESHQVKVTTESFKDRVENEINPNFEVIGEYINSATKIDVKCRICNGIFGMTPDNIIKGQGCPYCANQKALKGFNDISTTHPDVFNLLKDKNFGYTHLFYTYIKTDFVCKNCGSIIHSCPSAILDKNGNIICPSCKDGYSYPEKFMYNLLNQLGIRFKFQLTSNYFKWCEKYRYDFYLIDYNTIIETHGLQHYEDTIWYTYEEAKKIDDLKLKLALENGIDKYIQIDCRYSDPNYIKENILKSELKLLFDLNSVDFNKCGTDASKTIVKIVCDLWDNQLTVPDIAKKLGIANITVKRYLERGTKLGLCDFDNNLYKLRLRKITNKKISLGQHNAKRVLCKETGEIFRSIADARRKYNIHPSRDLFTNPNRTSQGYHWSYVD